MICTALRDYVPHIETVTINPGILSDDKDEQEDSLNRSLNWIKSLRINVGAVKRIITIKSIYIGWSRTTGLLFLWNEESC
jgi:hypothetical protein